MPEPGSKRARRARPASTTTRTSGMVSEVSAIAVASTSRRPSASGARARRCSAKGRPPCSGCSTTPGGRRGARRAAVRAISAWPGRKTSAPPSVSARARERQLGDRLLEARALPRRRDHGRSSQRVSTGQARPSAVRIGASSISAATGAASSVADITRRRRSGRSAAAALEREREAEVGLQRALVELVEDHAADAGEVGVGLEHPGQDALGHHLDAAARHRLAADAVADAAPDRLAEAFGQPLGGGAGGDAARLEHQDAAGRCRRRAGRAARAWSCRRRAAPAARRGRRPRSACPSAGRTGSIGSTASGLSPAARAPPGRSWSASRCARAAAEPSPFAWKTRRNGNSRGSPCCAPRPRAGRRCRAQAISASAVAGAAELQPRRGASRRRRRRVVSQMSVGPGGANSTAKPAETGSRVPPCFAGSGALLRGGSTETRTGAPLLPVDLGALRRPRRLGSAAVGGRAPRCPRRRPIPVDGAVEVEVERRPRRRRRPSMRLAAE